MSEASHAMPQSLRRVAKGEYAVKDTELRIVQGEDGKWKVEGHSDDLRSFASRGAALGKLQELRLVPEVPAEQPKSEAKVTEQPQGEKLAEVEKAQEQPKRRPRARKPAEEAATV
jgi:hypothetical protein